jgi:deazaflavin-dependent oxidoreductase (nitroreductase family)
MLFVGVDWAEDHHDVCVMAEDGRVLGKRRVPDSVVGIGELHALVAEHADDDDDEIVVGIEVDRGLLVGSLVSAGYEVFAVNPMASARYRDATRSLGQSQTPATPRCWLTWCALIDTITDRWRATQTFVVVASRGGDDTNPAWFLNLRDDPKVIVKLGSKPSASMIAEIADADERARIWPIIASRHRDYAAYQRKTDREIPLVFLRLAGVSQVSPEG